MHSNHILPTLPLEVWDVIFGFLDKNSAYLATLVCQNWRILIESNHLPRLALEYWKNAYKVVNEIDEDEQYLLNKFTLFKHKKREIMQFSRDLYSLKQKHSAFSYQYENFNPKSFGSDFLTMMAFQALVHIIMAVIENYNEMNSPFLLHSSLFMILFLAWLISVLPEANSSLQLIKIEEKRRFFDDQIEQIQKVNI